MYNNNNFCFRHQCEFNAEKVVLKPDADMKDVDKGMRIKYDCTTCGKQFVSKNNLERHQSSHDNTKKNICEHCNKQFVSENRLRIHKENHCKKAGDISKFYRSDVAVWKCCKCNQVFATGASANAHADICKVIFCTFFMKFVICYVNSRLFPIKRRTPWKFKTTTRFCRTN